MTTEKPHKGTIESWFKWPRPPSGYGLGYVIVGHSVCHPEFGGGPIRTSLVVKHEGSEIETLNSRYTLGRPAIDADPAK